MKVIEDAYKDDRNIVIALGSCQEANTQRNPFSAEERTHMLEQSLDAKGIRAKIIPVPDITCDDSYVRHLEKFVGKKSDRIMTENPWTVELFRKAGYDVSITPRYFSISASDIRDRITKGKPWTNFVPKEVAKVIKEVDGVKRIKGLFS